ncbi:MAG: hypothetical protein ACRDP8_11205, partial [Actinopolymorphaceae bacterium]
NATDSDRPTEFRNLGDSPAVGVMLNPFCGRFVERPAPTFTADGGYDFGVTHRPIRVYESIDTRFLFEDFFAKLRRFATLGASGTAPAAGT